MKKIYFEQGQNYIINKDVMVSVTRFNTGKEVEVKHVTKTENYLKQYKRINKKEYLNCITGEILKYNFKEDNEEKRIKRSMKRLKSILKNNFTGSENELFITLTTQNKVNDVQEIKKDFNKFWKKLKELNRGLEYVYVIEKQEERNSLHIHLLLKDTAHKKLYISNDDIQKLWKQGFTKVKSVGNIDKIISYMTKFKSKIRIAQGKNLYFKSKGIKNAVTEKMKYKDIVIELDNKYDIKRENTILVKSKKTNCIVNKVKTENWIRR